MTFGEKFRMERKRLGMTQQAVADALGVHLRMITNYEKGNSHPRKRETYQKIADLFQVPLEDLMADDERFVLQASEKYGYRGKKQAQQLIDDMSGLFAGGTLSEQDKDAVMRALQEIYWESKARSVEKYTPKKYRKETE